MTRRTLLGTVALAIALLYLACSAGDLLTHTNFLLTFEA